MGRLLAALEILGPEAGLARSLPYACLKLLASDSLQGPNQKEKERQNLTPPCKSLSG